MLFKHVAVLAMSLLFAVPATATGEKEWNLLVYLNGVNSLDDFGKLNINQMEEVGSTDNFNVVVQWGSLAAPTVKRMQIKKDNDQAKITSPVVQDLGRIDMGDPKQLVSFVTWAQNKYPSRRTIVVVWNHGGGWHFAGGPRRFSPLDISYDERTGNSIDTVELGQAMREIKQSLGRQIDVYASDACLMGMIEVAAEMADSVNYFVGSQDYEPGEGWSYGTLLSRLNAGGSNQSSLWVAQQISHDYAEAYSYNGRYGESPVTMSAFDLSKLEPLQDSIREIKNQLVLLSSSDLKQIGTTSSSVKQFTSDYLDLTDFMGKAAYSKLSTKAAGDYEQAVKDFVIVNDQNIDQSTHGISIWLPTNRYDSDMYMSKYQDLRFDKSVGWSYLLTKIIQ